MKLIICEKPDQASKIKMALVGENDIEVMAARGHLVELSFGNEEKGDRWTYPNIMPPDELRIAPIDSDCQRILDNMATRFMDADVIISATDLDREGSAIFYEILLYVSAKLGRDFSDRLKRMEVSSLTTKEIQQSWKKLKDFDWGRSMAGYTRNIQDMQWGINLTRALTLAAQGFDPGQSVLSGGRVQTAILKIIYDRDKLIADFVPDEYHQIKVICDTDAGQFEAIYDGPRIDSKERADEIVADITGADTVVDVKHEDKSNPPPAPFNGTDLQVEGNKVTGISAKEIADRSNGVAQKLYTKGIISYPGTDSQKHPADWEDKDFDILYDMLDKVLSGFARSRKRPVEGGKEDPAHPAIRPVSKVSEDSLDAKEAKLYNLICRRCAAGFMEDSVDAITNFTMDINGHPFKAIGKVLKVEGWREVYPYGMQDDKSLPDVNDGDDAHVAKVKREKKTTKPKPHYNTITIITEADKKKLGTKNTRPAIIDKLVKRGYVKAASSGKKKVMTVTPLGRKVIDVLTEFAPMSTNTSMTIMFENNMDDIEQSENAPSEFESRNTEMLEALSEIMTAMKTSHADIGARLTDIDRDEYIKCPTCGKAMVERKAKKTKTRFVGCTGYPECDTSFFLNPGEQLRKGLKCKCGLPLASGVLNDFNRGDLEYVRCLANCSQSPLICAKCGNVVRPFKSRKGGSFVRCCDTINNFEMRL